MSPGTHLNDIMSHTPAPWSTAAVLWNTSLNPQFISQMHHPFILCSLPTRLFVQYIVHFKKGLRKSVAQDVKGSIEYSWLYTVSYPYFLDLFQVEPVRCVKRSSATRFAPWVKWPESSQSSGLTLSLIFSFDVPHLLDKTRTVHVYMDHNELSGVGV